ncbi:MAG: type II secretion system F family protein [Gemmataceae bacterium]
MRDMARGVLAFVSLLSAAVVVIGLLVALMIGGLLPLPLLLLLGLIYGWMLNAFLIYRVGRQDEVLHLLAATAEQGAPLAPALRAYLQDRPKGGWRAFWTATLLFFVIPGYYWFWYRRHNYERRLARVAGRLEQGVPLHEALAEVRGVMPQATVTAVGVGESIGRLSLGLRRSNQGQLMTVWLEAVPRLLYPIILLLFLLSVLTFWMLYLLPRFQRIFKDFGIELPEMTRQIMAIGRSFEEYPLVIPLAILALIAAPILLYLYPGLLEYVPGVRRLYRMAVQSRMLRMLGMLVEAGKPLPEAMAVLAAPGQFAPAMTRRLQAVRAALAQGEPLADSLVRGRLMPGSMAPLVSAAERAHNLPWALSELGEHLAMRVVRLTRQISLILFPTAVLLIGLVIGFFVIGMFVPLIKLISEMA